MRIQVISDLHREFGFTDINFGTADILILAGDTDIGIKGISWIKSCQLYDHNTDLYIHVHYNGKKYRFDAKEVEG